tara:strand:+ start:405 stop:1745 length:1341 start_codon:yes stop_codon:yes gene_type:complete
MVMITNSFDKFPNEPTGLMYEQFGKIGLNPATATTFEDDFDYATQSLADTAWVPTNTTYGRVNISTDKLDFDFDTGDGNGDKQVYHDLTSIGTNWTIRFKLNWSALTSQSNAYMYVGLTDSTGSTDTSQNGFMMRFINAPTSGAVYVNFGVNQVSNTAPRQLGGSGANMVYTTSKDYYVEMKKDGTSLTATVFENSDFTGTWQTATQTITTTITPSLRYLHFWNSMSGSTGAWTGTIDDVEFYNGVTTVEPASTKVKQHFIEWFSGKQLPSYWTQTQVNIPATFAMSDTADGGFRITADGGANNEGMINFNNKRQYEQTGSVFIGVMKDDTNTAITTYCGFANSLVGVDSDSPEIAQVYNPSVNTNKGLRTGDATTKSTTEGSTALDTAWTSYKVENKTTDIELTVNGVKEIDKTTNRPTVKLQPVCGVFGNGKSVNIRYMECYNT